MRKQIIYNKIHDATVIAGPISLIAALALGYSGIALIIVLIMFALAE